jgi:hypothetical protein
MSRTHRHHLADSKRAKRGGQPKLRSLSARAAYERQGAGVHGLKSNKQKRRQDKQALRKEDHDA